LALRNTSPRLRETYFMPEGEGRFRVTPAVRRMVQFGRLNLRGAVGEMPLARFDAIFCRNVLIYFGQEARRDVLTLLHDRLLPGGYLFVGRSETSLDLSHHFEFANLVQDAAYQRSPA
jgi:chemotaxis protein methyltransferase CheR